jgi:hypothetical protein
MERRAFMMKTRFSHSECTMNIFYIIGVIVVVLFVAGFFGLHAWTQYLAEPTRSGTQVGILNPSTPGERECCADRIEEHPIVSQNAIRRSEG